MPPVLLNREMRAGDIPAVPVSRLDPPDGGVAGYGRNPAAWATLWRFALTFDPEYFRSSTGKSLDPERDLRAARDSWNAGALKTQSLTALRSALWQIFSETQGTSIEGDSARLIDEMLDVMYGNVAGFGTRRRIGPVLDEPGIGSLPGAGAGQKRRFWFLRSEEADETRHDLYDRVAGTLLREVGDDFMVASLFLYPPRYPIIEGTGVLHVFWLAIRERFDRGATGINREEEEGLRLQTIVGRALEVEMNAASPW